MYLVTCTMNYTPPSAQLTLRGVEATSETKYVPCDDLPTADAEANNMLAQGGASVQVWLLYRSAAVKTETIWTDHTRSLGAG